MPRSSDLFFAGHKCGRRGLARLLWSDERRVFILRACWGLDRKKQDAWFGAQGVEDDGMSEVSAEEFVL